MDVSLKRFAVAFLIHSISVLAVPLQAHEPGGKEHIVIIDRHHPSPPHVSEVLDRLALSEDHSDVRHVFRNSAFKGFAASMKSHCLDLLSNMSDVKIVERTVTVTKASLSTRSGAAYNTRSHVPWGLQRISTSSLVDGSPSALNYVYSYDTTSLGQGSDVYILDTGIYTAHDAFNGRASMLWSYNGNMEDVDGHGTHVAGTAAGDVFGVASNANIYGIKALDSGGGGWSSDVVAGIDYVIRRHDSRRGNDSFAGSVISMSLASNSLVGAINQAVEAAVEAGIHVCVAAGNAGADACTSSPASAGGTHGGAITVGAVDIDSHQASFSNAGDCVDVYAPGVAVISAWPPGGSGDGGGGAPNVINSLTGTSMSAPHVSGIVAAAMAANASLAASPTAMKQWVRDVAIRMRDGTLLANNGVRADVGQGLLGREKFKLEHAWALTEPKDAGAVQRLRRAVFSFFRSSMVRGRNCAFSSWWSPSVGAWDRDARRAWTVQS